MKNERKQYEKHFDLSHLQELADVLVPIVLEPRGSGYWKYMESHPVKPLEDNKYD